MSSAIAIVLVVVVFATLLTGGGYANSVGLIAAAAAMAILVAVPFVRSGRKALEEIPPLAGPAILFFVVLGVAGVQLAAGPTLDRELVLIHLLRLLGAGAVFLAAVSVGRSVRALRVLQKGAVIAGVGFVLLALGLYALHPHTAHDADGGRLAATFPTSPNTAAAVIGLIALVSLGGLLQTFRRLSPALTASGRLEKVLSKAWLEIAALGLAVVTLGLTGSRSGVALIILTAIALIAWRGSRDKGADGLGGRALALLTIVVAVGVGASVTFARLPGIGGDAASRSLIYQTHWPRLFDQPVLGHGLGSFLIVNRAIANAAHFAALTWAGDMHDVYMQWIEETGFVGAGAMFGCIAWILAVIVRGAGRAETSRSWLKTVVAASLFLMLQGLVEIALQYEGVVFLWCLLLGSAFGVASKRPEPQPDKAS